MAADFDGSIAYQAALDLVATRMPDLVLLDLMMPVMDGFEFMHRFREMDAAKNIPVIVVTAKTLDADERRALEGSVEQIRQKNAVTPQDLVEAIRHLDDRASRQT